MQIVGNQLLYVTCGGDYGRTNGPESCLETKAFGMNRCPGVPFALGFASHNYQEAVLPEERGRKLCICQFIAEKSSPRGRT
jgi:hypothetical protein